MHPAYGMHARLVPMLGGDVALGGVGLMLPWVSPLGDSTGSIPARTPGLERRMSPPALSHDIIRTFSPKGTCLWTPELAGSEQSTETQVPAAVPPQEWQLW